MKQQKHKSTRRALAWLLSVVLALSCFSAGLSALAAIDGVPTRTDAAAQNWFSDSTLYSAKKWDKSTDLSTLTFNWSAYSSSLGYDPQPGTLTFTYPSHIYLNVGESLEAAGYMGHMTASYGENDGSDVTDFRVMLSSATWGESTRSGFGDVIGELISNYGHQGTCTEGSKLMSGSSSHYDFANDGRGSDQIIGNKTSDNENFQSDNESVVVWRSNIQWTGSEMNNFDEYVLLTGTANKTGEVTFNPTSTQNFTIGAAQRYTAFAWHSDNGTRFNRFLMNGGSRPQVAPAEDALSITFTVYDKSELNRLIEAADAGTLTADPDALAAARAVLADREVTQAQIDAAADSIGDRMTMLVNGNVNAYTAGGDPFGTAANTFDAQAFHCGDVATGGYKNIVYAPSWSTSWYGWNGDNYYAVGRIGVKFATPENVVMVYDGVSGHEPYAPIEIETVAVETGGSAYRAVYAYKTDKSMYNLGNYKWSGSITENQNASQSVYVAGAWQNWAKKYTECDSFDAQGNNGNTSSDTLRDQTSRFWWNVLAYQGTGNYTSYYDVETNPEFYVRTRYGNTNKDGTVMAKTSYYTINYKPVYDKLDDAAAVKAIIDNADEVWKYTDASVKRVKATLAVMEKANPKSYGYSNVAGDVQTCANYISDAVYMFDHQGLVLEKKQGTVTFVSQTGETLAINGQPATYTREYGETIAANEIPQLSNVYYRTDNAQWDYSEDLEWSPALPATITFDEPEKIFQISDDQTVQTYTVTFYDDDGTTVLATADWQYGDYPDYGGTVVRQNPDTVEVTAPTKQDYDYNYECTGWQDGDGNTFNGLNTILNKFEVNPVEGSSRSTLEAPKYTEYTAVYTATARTDADYSAYDTALANAQAVLAIPGLDSAAAAAIQAIIDTEIARAHDTSVTPSRNYRSDDEAGVEAIATAVTNLNAIVSTYTDGEGNLKDEYLASYTITWNNADDLPIGTETLKYGATPSHAAPAVPASYDTEHYTYTFDGWKCGETTYGQNDTLPTVTGDATYTAQFTATPKSYAVTITAGANTTLTVKNGDTVLTSGTEVPYGTVLTIEAAPTAAYSQNTVTVKVNDVALTDMTYTVIGATAITTDAIAESNINKYTVKFFDLNNQQIGETQNVPYGNAATAPVLPIKAPDETYHYAVEWDKPFNNITGNTNVTAVATGTAHNWNYADASYAWNTDKTVCTAIVTCTGCAQTKDIASTSVSASEPDYNVSCTTDVDVTCSAVFTESGLAATTTKTVGKGNIHNYSGEPTWSDWTQEDDEWICTATFECSNHDATTAGTVTYDKPYTDPTCTVDGYWIYTAATEMNGVTYTNTITKTVVDQNTAGHSMTHEARVEAKCNADGHVEYYYCSKCETYYEDAQGTTPISNIVLHDPNAHDYSGTPTLIRPVKDGDNWTSGTYTWTCKNDENHEPKTEPVARANYTKYNSVLEQITSLLGEDLTDDVKAALQTAKTAMEAIQQDYVVPEQGRLDGLIQGILNTLNENDKITVEGDGNGNITVSDDAYNTYDVDFGELTIKKGEAEEILALGGYTDETTAALTEAIAQAATVLAENNEDLLKDAADALEQEVADAIAALNAAIELAAGENSAAALLEAKEELLEAIQQGNALDTTGVDEALVAALTTALEDGQDVYDNDDATLQEVEAATQAILDAILDIVKEQLEDAIAAGNQTSEDYTTEEHAEALHDAIGAGETLIENNSDNIEAIKQATQDILDAIAAIENDYIDALIQDLLDAIEEGNNTNTDNATTAHADALADAIEAGQALIDNESRDAEDLIQAADDIRDAILDVLKDELADKLEEADDFDTTGATEDLVTALEDAITNGETVLGDPSATAEEIKDAIDAIDNAITAIEADRLAVAKAELLAAINQGNALDTTGADEALVAALNTALADGQDVYDDNDATLQQVKDATQAILDAILAIVKEAAKAAIEAAAGETPSAAVQAIVDQYNGTDSTDGSIDGATTVAQVETLKQEALDAIAAQQAYDAAKAELEAKLAEAQTRYNEVKDDETYTQESKDALRDEIAAAQAILANAASTKNDFITETGKLTNAINGLTRVAVQNCTVTFYWLTTQLSITVPKGEGLTPPDVADVYAVEGDYTGHQKFIGWYTDVATLQNKVTDFSNIQSDMELYGVYETEAHVGSWTTHPATCSAPEYKDIICESCHEYFRQDTGGLAECDWGEPVVVEPTCAKAGTRTYTCQNNPDHVKVETIDPLPHTPNENQVCTVCGQPLQGHSHTDWNNDSRCDTCGRNCNVHQHVDRDGNGACDGCGCNMSDGSFRCNMCSFWEEHRSMPVFGWIVTAIHFFYHLICQIISWR